MIRTGSLAVLAALMAGPAVGQESKPVAPAAKSAEMAEDVEILRRLLNKAVGLDGQPRSTSPVAMAYDHAGGTLVGATPVLLNQLAPLSGPTPVFDGVYLKGHGVAYTVRLTALEQAFYAAHEKLAGLEATCQNCHRGADTAKFNLTPVAAVKPPTEWEKARDELRGGTAKVDPAAPRANLAAMCFPGNLTESVTKLLAANGRHLRHLAADESVSVVVTYDGVSGPAHDRTAGTMADPGIWEPKPPVAPATYFGLTPDEAKQIVLGDLHLKQGKYDAAVKAFETALARYPVAVVTIDVSPNVKAAERDAAVAELQKNVTAAYRSLAQAHIGAGNLDEAKRALNLAQQLKIEPAGGAKKAATPVPAKIVLTVKKAHLDAADNLTPVQLRKGFSVEMTGLSATKK